MNVAIRVDASIDIGSGHVMRCLTLAEQFRENGDNVIFICRETLGSKEVLIKEKGFSVHSLPFIQGPLKLWMLSNWQMDAYETNKILAVKNIDLLILDHYAIDSKWESKVKTENLKVLVIDDGEERYHNCEVFLNPTYGAQNNKKQYELFCGKNTLFLLGTNFMILREEFDNIKGSFQINSSKIYMHVFFGGMDFNNYTLKFSEFLVEEFDFVHLLIVVGKDYEFDSELEELKKRYNKQITIYKDITNMAEIMKRCHVAFGAPGTTTWERAALGIPSAYLSTADNQIQILKQLSSENICLYLGEADKLGKKDFLKCMKKFLFDREKLSIYKNNSKKIINIDGKKQIVNAVKGWLS